VPDDGSCKLKYVAEYYVTLKCYVGWSISVVCDIGKCSGIYQNKTCWIFVSQWQKWGSYSHQYFGAQVPEMCYHWLWNITMEHQNDPGSYTVTAIAVVMILLMGIPLLWQFRMICFK